MVFPRGPVDTQTGIAGFLDEVARGISGGQLQIKRDDPDAAERFNAFISQAAQQFAQESGEPTESVFSQITGFLNRPLVQGPSISDFLGQVGENPFLRAFTPGSDVSRSVSQQAQAGTPPLPEGWKSPGTMVKTMLRALVPPSLATRKESVNVPPGVTALEV